MTGSFALLACLFAIAQPAHSRPPDSSPPPDFPGSRPLDVPATVSDSEAEDLPRLRAAEPKFAPGDPRVFEPQIWVEKISIEGNSVLPPTELTAVAQNYVGRWLGAVELESLRRELTERYVEAGYVNSGAVLPDQDFEAGVLRVRVVEGRLIALEIEATDGFRQGFLRRRLEGATNEILNVVTLERRLQRLQSTPQVRSLHAELRPGLRAGQSILVLEVIAEDRYGASLEAHNHQSPAIGAINGRVGFWYDNALGLGDHFAVHSGGSRGLADVDVQYGLPVSRRDTRLDLRFRYSATRIVEDLGEDLDIEGRFWSAGGSLSHPVYRAGGAEVELGLAAEWRQSRNTLGESEIDDGVTRAGVLRFFQAASLRSRNQVLAVRSTLNVGLEFLGTKSTADEPADFVSWIGQAQWIRRLDGSGIEFLARGDVQLALDPLLSFERFSVGGRYSVRGYRQNRLVRDSGYALGLEVRVPVLRRPDGVALLQLVPFVDAGRAWSRGRGGSAKPRTLAGAGAGLVWRPRDWMEAELYYGADLLSVERAGETDLSDQSVYFRLAVWR